ncbi:tRNA glutamyl-Q(34) synthetase GluQRS [Paenibacillus sp. MMS18-CY102]|uniref:tRNA glutamyl-Q(34) synthetase GluQRS n=1 Tax=Paenibacillus sp. MMS18-CY102 TaxID=2682849 RepID=UPI0013652160|nr:tRNA glutamyl-Q(34) synthetase GluQRS [Paenibacillus sp. MMS18-CY102]MWC31216.1 tRNA glutamyl-Q(34) synthetase GluQRS [Paenibacillus sp. MMS18-CY102]
MLRGRFAPTPSGLMHIGNARTALLAWLQIRQASGQFVLRMEDIDKPRSKPHFAHQALEDLRWLGIDWDEGPDVGGPHAPYVQSLREPLYAEALERLEQRGQLYPCFCSRAELLAVASAPHGLSAEGPAYAGTCRYLNETERAARRLGKLPSIRFAIGEQAISFQDGIAGQQDFPPGAGGDFVVRRADELFSYQLAVVVDDIAMGITDVLRGYDLLDSTPRQLALYDALGASPPRFAHVPLLLGTDGNRLAKRDGSLSLAAIRERGIQPERVIGLLAAMSGLIARAEPIQAAELIANFNIDRIPHEPAIVDQSALQWLYNS